MSVDSWFELSTTENGLFQLAGTPTSNYNLLLYGKALLARRSGQTIFFIDNHNVIDHDKLKNDLDNDTTLIRDFFLFTPKNLIELYSIIDDLELLYFQSAHKPVIFISGIFEFLLNKSTNNKSLTIMAHILGLLKEFAVPVFVTNEMRSMPDFDVPFLSFYLPTFFSKVLIISMKGKETEILNYTY